MPILAGFPVVREVRDVVNPRLDSRRLAFRTLNGTETLPFTGNEFIALWGAQGLDVPDPNIEEGTAPGVDGSFIDDVTIGSRDVVLPIYFGSKSGHIAHLAQRAYLRSFFNFRGVDLARHDGTFDLVATSATGERSLRCMYRSGLSGEWVADSSGSYWQTTALQLLAVRTYWYGPRWQTPTIRGRQTGSRWLGIFPPRLSSLQAFGINVPVVVPGDVESWARVDITGPCSSILIEAAGLHISMPDGLASGEHATIDTDPRARRIGEAVMFSGEEDWARVAPDDTWDALQPGLQPISLVIEGGTEATTAVVSGATRWETPW